MREARRSKRAGREVVVADMFDPDQLVAAMRGAQHAYYVPPYTPYAIQSAVTFAVAAREAKLEAIVQMRQWTSHRNHPALMTRQTWLMDKMFAELHGIVHTILNPGLFADDFSAHYRFRGAARRFSRARRRTAKWRRSPTRTSRGSRSLC